NNIEINLSLNAADLTLRKKFTRDRNPETAVNSPKYLALNNISYTTSLVAVNTEKSYSWINDTIEYVFDNKTDYVKVFVPGYTKFYSPDYLKVDIDELKIKLNQIRKKYPVIIEPDYVDGKALIQGVLLNTPAKKADLKFDDEILAINEKKVFSASDAHNMLTKKQNPIIKILRNNKEITLELKKQENQSSGILLKSDISSENFESIKNTLTEKSGIVCSEYAAPLMQRYFGNCVKVIKNNFFGGNIRCNGLLTVDDIIESLKEREFENLIIHGNFLNNNDEDIKGVSIYNLVTDKKINPVVLE
ncbi:MAG: DUF512 domain-containing protein, partial [Candidatus Muiribacteriota bacterium]